MKTMLYLLAAALLTGFSSAPSDNDFDGIWMGYYRSSTFKEKMMVKFDQQDRIEFFTGGVDDKTRSEGNYTMEGDSVVFNYKTRNGEELRMIGHFNRRKNYLDGVWNQQDKSSGSFYLEKQKFQECYAQP